MRALAFAKLNLGLRVVGRRPDGYHELDTVFQSIDLHDTLVLEPADDLTLAVDGAGQGTRALQAPAGEDNLVLRAARALAAAAGTSRGASLRLSKRIPAGGGLGGGSSDAAVTLVALDRLWGCSAAADDLARLAAGLGADVPYFLVGGTARGTGRGDRIEPVDELPRHHVVLALPGIHLSTAEVFRAHAASSALAPPRPRAAGEERVGSHALHDGLANDLERAAFALAPSLVELKRRLEEAGAVHALMSGSGSTVYGLYADHETARAAQAGLARSGVTAVLTQTLDRREYLARRLVDEPAVGDVTT